MEERRRVEARFESDRWEGPEWLITGATLRERLNEPYDLRLDLALASPDAHAEALLGSSCVVTLSRRDTSLRVCGLVTMVREGVAEDDRTLARLSIEPALSALRYRLDSRIFQDLTTPEILEQVLSAGLSPFSRAIELRLEGSYPSREYTVQYDETDYEFAHRLMEEEGIGYSFEHAGEHEVMVLFDRPAHALPIESEDGATLRFVGRLDEEMEASEGVARFESVTRVRANRVVTQHFDWTHPSVPLVSAQAVPDSLYRGGGAFPALETYVHDAPVTFSGFDHAYGAHNGADQLRLYAERAGRDAWLTDGTTSSLAVREGRRFTLVDHPRSELDGDWVVVSTEHQYQSHVSGEDGGGLAYVNRLTCLPAAVPWRPDRLRKKPRIHGVQTATVVGPAGEEIHCDPHGRVKLHFHWDRLGNRTDHDSCWIRVMQAMGGAGWGFSFIPRVGMEVVVTFIEGNPDQPLVTGVVYNGENPCPYDFPADKTRTTIKSNSSPGGNGFNEFRLEDKAGQEEIWLHGEKDWNTLIKNDLHRRVGHNESQEVEVDRKRDVGNDEQVHVGHDRQKRVDNDESYSVGHDRKRLVENNEQIDIGADRNKTIGANETVNIGKNASQSIGQNLTQKIAQNALQTIGMNLVQNVAMTATKNVVLDDTHVVGGSGKRDIGKSLTEKIGEDLTQKIKQNLTSNIGMNRIATVTMNDVTIVGMARTATVTRDDVTKVIAKSTLTAKAIVQESETTMDVTVKEKLTIKCGDAIISIEGSVVTISGKQLVLEGKEGVHIKSGSGNVKIDGLPKIQLNC